MKIKNLLSAAILAGTFLNFGLLAKPAFSAKYEVKKNESVSSISETIVGQSIANYLTIAETGSLHDLMLDLQDNTIETAFYDFIKNSGSLYNVNINLKNNFITDSESNKSSFIYTTNYINNLNLTMKNNEISSSDYFIMNAAGKINSITLNLVGNDFSKSNSIIQNSVQNNLHNFIST